MYYITGDRHANFKDIIELCKQGKLTSADTVIILGDSGFNYDYNTGVGLKRKLSKYGLTLFCIHGNHEERPENISTYVTKEWNKGVVFYEEEYPNILFAKDGEVYDIAGKSCLVIGGAYSVDKFYRLAKGYKWFASEQPNVETKQTVIDRLNERDWEVDCVFTHTCPYKYEPTEFFMQGVDQSAVDKTTEHWLDKIEQKLNYKRWYCGHFHCEKHIANLQFLFLSFQKIGVSDVEFDSYVNWNTDTIE